MSEISPDAERRPNRKIYVIDTSVFMHDPDVVEHLEDNIIVVPIWVVEELDKLKKHANGRGSTARLASRRLDEYQGSLKDGVETKSGGELYISYDINEQDGLPVGLELTNDNRVILVAMKWQRTNGGRKVVLISKDTNLRLKANACGIYAEDYRYNKGAHFDDLYTGTATIAIGEQQLSIFDRLQEKGFVSEAEISPVPGGCPNQLFPNQCCIFTDIHGNSARVIYKKAKRQFVALRVAPRKSVVPKNPEQEFAYALLMDPDILLITLIGRAGTGKTLMALLAGYASLGEPYKQMVVYRPNIELGRSLGFLPGTLEEKFEPWMQPILDNFDLIFKTSKTGDETKGVPGRGRKGAKPDPDTDQVREFMNHGMFEISPISFLRGRSLHHRFVIIDEAQNLTPHEIKTIITRIGSGSKVVLTGDLEQIDNNFLDATSNGLFYVVQHFKGQEIYGHIAMQKTERSRLAELAAKLL